jgi:hypothetical protein
MVLDSSLIELTIYVILFGMSGLISANKMGPFFSKPSRGALHLV